MATGNHCFANGCSPLSNLYAHLIDGVAFQKHQLLYSARKEKALREGGCTNKKHAKGFPTLGNMGWGQILPKRKEYQQPEVPLSQQAEKRTTV